MKYKSQRAASIFFMTIVYRRGGHGPLAPPPGSATDTLCANQIIEFQSGKRYVVDGK